jgi:hypothetical protein
MLISVIGYILSGLVGGLFAAILYPFVVHIGVRRYNKLKVIFSVDPVDRLNCRVTNNSFVTLKNVVVYVTVNNTKEDIAFGSGLHVFCSDKQILEDRLSWAKNVEGKNASEIDIHQGESQKLNLIRLHTIDSKTVIEVASEQGFYSKELENTSRSALIEKNYIFKIKIIGDNLWPLERTFTYNQSSREITEI